MTGERTTIIIPDVHLGWKHRVLGDLRNYVHEIQLQQFLIELARQVEAPDLIMLGDLVDFERNEPMHGYVTLISCFAKLLHDVGKEPSHITWLLGNHDHHLHNLIRGRLQLLKLLRHTAWELRKIGELRGWVSDLEDKLYQQADNQELQDFFASFAGKDINKAQSLRDQVVKILDEGDTLRRGIETETGCMLAYPFVEFTSSGKRIFVTHADVCDFMLLFDRLEHPLGGWFGRLCRRLAGLQKVRRTDMFGFHDWIYAESKRSVEQFERFFKQPAPVLTRLVAEFLTSDYARRALSRWFRIRTAIMAKLLVPCLGPSAAIATWWRNLTGQKKRHGPLRLGARASKGFFITAAAWLTSASVLGWLLFRPQRPLETVGGFLLELVLLALVLFLPFIIGLLGSIWLFGIQDILIDSIEAKAKWLENAITKHWFGDKLKQPEQLIHLIIGHFHFPEQGTLADLSPEAQQQRKLQWETVTDAGAWMGDAAFYVLDPQQPDAYTTSSKPICSYVEVRNGKAHLYNYLGPGHRLRFLEYRKVPGKPEPVRFWVEEVSDTVPTTRDDAGGQAKEQATTLAS